MQIIAGPLATEPALWSAVSGHALQRAGRHPFGIDRAAIGGARVEVRQTDRLTGPFGALTTFGAEGAPDRDVLVVAPLAGGAPVLLRDFVLGLVPHARVSVTDWFDIRTVPLASGRFGLDQNVAHVVRAVEALGPEVHVVGICQGAVPALAATALLAGRSPAATPASLTLMGGPIDPAAAPTRLTALMGQHSADWCDHHLFETVPEPWAGAGRRVYPASRQGLVLAGYLTRHMMAGSELAQHLILDDGADPLLFPLGRLITTLVDLPAELFLDTVLRVFQERALMAGTLRIGADHVRPELVRSTALMTVEGRRDDISAPGQTVAAHGLCRAVPGSRRRRLTVDGAGHFSLFYGGLWRAAVLPALLEFWEAAREPSLQAAS